MGRGCMRVLATFAIAAAGGTIFAWIWLAGIPTPPGDMEGGWATQITFFTAPGIGLACGGGGALITGILALRRGEFAGSGSAIAPALFVAAFLFGYYGVLSAHEILVAVRAIPEPADPFLISRRVAPLVALVLAIAAGAWAYLRVKATAEGGE